MAVVFLGGEHPDQLAAAVVDFLEFADVRVGQGADFGGDDFAEVSQDTGINGVGFGENAQALGKIADLASIDHDSGEPGTEQRSEGGFLVGAGRLKDDPFGLQLGRPSDELGDAFRIIGEAAWRCGGSGGRVEVLFANVNTDVDACHGQISPRVTR
jgi:hypothetical protein